MKSKKLFAMISASAIPAMLPAVVLADAQETTPGLDKVFEVQGAAGIFTLSAGPIPVTERTRVGERKLMVLEDEYARKLGWLPPEHGVAGKEGKKLAMAASKTLTDCTDAGGCTKTDSDKGF